MTILEREMHQELDIERIKVQIAAMSGGEILIWKKTVLADESLFNLLFQLIFSDDHRLAWRSCWIIDHASEENPVLLADKLPAIIKRLLSVTNSSLKRHFTRILCRYPIPDEYLGVLVNRCFELLSAAEPAAVRVHAMQLLYNITVHVPDLKGELICVIENLMEEGGSTGVMNRSSRLLRRLRS